MRLLTHLSIAFTAITAVSSKPINTTSPITTTKITPSYWRATFSNPPFNLQDNAFYAAFYALVDEISNDQDVKVVVFDSSVPDFYIAHFDTVNGVSTDLLGGYWANMTKLANLPVLTVASIRGYARGGGAELVAGLDTSFASKEKAVFAQFEVGVGAVPGGGGLALLPGLVGRSRALEIVIGADDFDADTAAQYGWINRAVPDHKLDHFVDNLAHRVSLFDKEAIAYAKSAVIARAGYPPAEEQQSDFAAFGKLASQPNFQARIAKLVELGLQTKVAFEKNITQEVLKTVGEGPWDV
ncbi:ClpP/crotonase-like domain-containing protein [Lophiotrema nucula]|uniref:ClpP/crotonase-like domain-containing protein n=1 Tax=Lophiotrema nucula TaxID=690887 RepID=A0A6A5YU67_9PLEO|nr:ClpP/crotonase-like domain-containing protein [Lophiotrema nucula]